MIVMQIGQYFILKLSTATSCRLDHRINLASTPDRPHAQVEDGSDKQQTSDEIMTL
jgi:hypothetical protein